MAIHLDGRGYAYETVREGDRVRRIYKGKGEMARLFVELERGRRIEKEVKRDKENAEAEAEQILIALVEQFASQVEILKRWALLKTGFRQHARGQWRRQRNPRMSKEIKNSNVESGILTDDKVWSELVAGAHKNAAGAQKFLAEVEKTGRLDSFLTLLADLGTRAQGDILKRVVKDDPLAATAFARQIELMTSELEGAHPTELEKQLAKRIVLEWLLLTYFEATLAVNLDSSTWTPYYEKRVESAQRRYLASIKTLAQIRKLQVQNVQINVAQNQVNAQLGG